MKQQKNTTLPKPVILTFFVIGLTSATSLRLIIIADWFDATLARFFWYLGVLGNVIFFGYRFWISKKRRAVIMQNKLQEKLASGNLTKDDCARLSYIVSSLVKSKEVFNYVYIFIMSALAIIVDLAILFYG
jgi:hypothetical protein